MWLAQRRLVVGTTLACGWLNVGVWLEQRRLIAGSVLGDS